MPMPASAAAAPKHPATVDDLTQALSLPHATRVNQRVPKKLLAEQGASTAADKRQVLDGVHEIVWLAALKPQHIGVPAWHDGQRHYLELAVLSLTLKPGARPGLLVELLHRAVPYPVLLFTSSDAGVGMSLAHLRSAHNEADKTVLDGELLSVPAPSEGAHSPAPCAFRAALALAQQPQTDLYALYQGWLDTVAALAIAHETGSFQPSHSRTQAAQRHQALQQHYALQAQLRQLHAAAQTERQLARQVALNQQLQAARTQLLALQPRLHPAPDL